MNRTQVQIEFEALCFMHEVKEAWLLRDAVRKYNDGELLNKSEKTNIAKSIWRL